MTTSARRRVARRVGAPPVVEAGRLRPAWAEIDLDAIPHNAAVLAELAGLIAAALTAAKALGVM